MSNKGGRKSHTAAVSEEKEKRTDSPVKEMKKKIAANAEKDKQTTDKPEKTVTPPEKSDKNSEKVTEKPQKVPEKPQNEKTDNKKAQNNEKVDKSAPTPEKNTQKPDKNAEKTDKSSEKDKPTEKSDKKTEKVADKKADKPAEKKNEPEKKEETHGEGKDKPEKPKQNGAANGDANGLDTVKSTKTPETPRPASYKEDDSKEKVLKMNDSLATDRKLRSADSPKREPKKPESKKAQDSPKKDKTIDLTEDDTEKESEAEKEKSDAEKEKSSGKNQLEMDVVIEVESLEETSDTRGRTRARVSPYTRPRHDQTTSSMMANYTGNNTTMEMDITETSSILEDNLDDSAYLRGLRTIRGRASYKPLKELSLKHTLNRSTRSVNSVTSLLESARPTGTVVGRKRKPDADDIELASEAAELTTELTDTHATNTLHATDTLHAQNKRMRLFERIAGPFRGFNTRAAEIVGINTDLPLTAPVASPPVFDPESLKASSDPIVVPLPTPSHDADAKRCAIM